MSRYIPTDIRPALWHVTNGHRISVLVSAPDWTGWCINHSFNPSHEWRLTQVTLTAIHLLDLSLYSEDIQNWQHLLTTTVIPKVNRIRIFRVVWTLDFF